LSYSSSNTPIFITISRLRETFSPERDPSSLKPSAPRLNEDLTQNPTLICRGLAWVSHSRLSEKTRRSTPSESPGRDARPLNQWRISATLA